MNKIGKIVSAVLALSLAGCSSTAAGSTGSTSANDHLAKIKNAGKIVIGLEGDWQPFSYHDNANALVGYDVEVGQNIAKKIGVDADIVEAAWDGLFAGLSSGTYDIVINGVDVTEEREKTFAFSDPYAYDHTVLVTKADNSDIHTFEDLKGKKTANSIGSTYMEIGEQYGASVSGVDTLAETMELVLNGTVDATVNAQTSVQDYLKTTGEKNLKVAAVSEDATSYAIPMVKNEDNSSLADAINQALKEMREDGTLAKLSEKYFGADLTNK
ncbi:MAG: transporter substrate-binding domain-containing protein [Erysipelotrichaceae bacterium]|nr:transporter substrate-binding domain-containing protein [Erysipelotrichaceae bacterium]